MTCCSHLVVQVEVSVLGTEAIPKDGLQTLLDERLQLADEDTDDHRARVVHRDACLW